MIHYTSRAKDCLVVLYPDDHICNASNYKYVNIHNTDNSNIESLSVKVTGKELSELTISAYEIEDSLFGKSNYLGFTEKSASQRSTRRSELFHARQYTVFADGFIKLEPK